MSKIIKLCQNYLPIITILIILTLSNSGCGTGPGGHPANSLFGLIHLVIWVVILIDILKSGMSSGNKILWILVVFLLPVLGLILYLLLGRKK